MLARGDYKAADILCIHCAIAACFFPSEADLDAPVEDLGVIVIGDVVEIVRRFALIEPILASPDDPIHPEVRTVARRIAELEANRMEFSGRKAQEAGLATGHSPAVGGQVRKLLDFSREQGISGGRVQAYPDYLDALCDRPEEIEAFMERDPARFTGIMVPNDDALEQINSIPAPDWLLRPVVVSLPCALDDAQKAGHETVSPQDPAVYTKAYAEKLISRVRENLSRLEDEADDLKSASGNWKCRDAVCANTGNLFPTGRRWKPCTRAFVPWNRMSSGWKKTSPATEKSVKICKPETRNWSSAKNNWKRKRSVESNCESKSNRGAADSENCKPGRKNFEQLDEIRRQAEESATKLRRHRIEMPYDEEIAQRWASRDAWERKARLDKLAKALEEFRKTESRARAEKSHQERERDNFEKELRHGEDPEKNAERFFAHMEDVRESEREAENSLKIKQRQRDDAFERLADALSDERMKNRLPTIVDQLRRHNPESLGRHSKATNQWERTWDRAAKP